MLLGTNSTCESVKRGMLESCGFPMLMCQAEVAFVATLRMNSVVVPARCVFIAQTFANEKSGSTTRLNVEEFDDDSDDSWQNDEK